jgi:cysteine desulfurase
VSIHCCFVDELGVDLLSVAGHKLYAPKGVGVLYVRKGVCLEPLIHGAGHESGRRAGTENILLDVALGTACELAQSWLGVDSMRKLRDLFCESLQARFGERVVLNGHPTQRLPNTLNVSFVGKTGSEILKDLEGVAASTGSACHSGSIELSPVLKAMGVPPEIGMGAVRFSLGRSTTREEIEQLGGGVFRQWVSREARANLLASSTAAAVALPSAGVETPLRGHSSCCRQKCA